MAQKNCHLKINGNENVKFVKQKTYKMTQSIEKSVTSILFIHPFKNDPSINAYPNC